MTISDADSEVGSPERPSFGVSFPLQGSFTYHEVRKLALIADRAGFASIWVGDHFFAPPTVYTSIGGDATKPDKLDAWTTLAAIATQTERATVGTAVSPMPFYNPGKLAKIVTTVDIISGGRVALGVGTGWFNDEAVAYGVPWHPMKDRREQLKEGITIMRSLFSNYRTNFQGKYYDFRNAPFFPKPLQDPIPIYVGGSSDAMLTTVGELGDGWLAVGLKSPEHFAERSALARDVALRRDRDPEKIAMIPFLSPDDLGKDGSKWKSVLERYHEAGAEHIVMTTAETRDPDRCAEFLFEFSKRVIHSHP